MHKLSAVKIEEKGEMSFLNLAFVGSHWGAGSGEQGFAGDSLFIFERTINFRQLHFEFNLAFYAWNFPRKKGMCQPFG